MEHQEEIFELIRKIRQKFPSLRFCQLLGNVTVDSLYYVSDVSLLEGLREYCEAQGIE